jgi:hypothetical protein
MGRPHRPEQKALREEFLLRKARDENAKRPGRKASGALCSSDPRADLARGLKKSGQGDATVAPWALIQ